MAWHAAACRGHLDRCLPGPGFRACESTPVRLEFLDLPSQLQTERLLLRRLREGEGEAMFDFVDTQRQRLQLGFPLMVREVTDARTGELFTRRKLTEWYLEKSYSFGIWKGVALIGYLSIKSIDWSVPKADMGYCLRGEAEGQGLMREAVQAAREFAHTQLGLGRLFLRIHPDNLASCRVAERCGFQFEGVLRNDFKASDGQWQDMRYYSSIP